MPIPPGTPDFPVERERMIGELRDLIAALDRRAPGVASGAERRIARDAAALKRQAVALLEELHDARAAGR
jgi:hypothetical protein